MEPAKAKPPELKSSNTCSLSKRAEDFNITAGSISPVRLQVNINLLPL